MIALDIDLIPFERMKAQIDFPSNIEVHDTRLFPLDQLPAASFDIITALDVLEHVDDLSGTLKYFKVTQAGRPFDRFWPN